MFNPQKNVFWEALLVTIFIFGIGVLAGVILENWRTAKINDLYQQSEVELSDIKIQSDIYSQGKFNCEVAINENIKFADKIYEEAKILDRYEGARRLTNNLIIQHNKYSLLKITLLLNSIKIKEICKSNYSNVVYFYIPFYKYSGLDIKNKQAVFSSLLGELKQKTGNQILLIPIAADTSLSSVNLIMNKYNISEVDLPVIFINEKTKITNIEKIEDLEKYLK